MSEDSTNPAPPSLEYAPRPRLAWFSRHRRLLILLSLIVAIGLPTWWNWQSLKRRALWLYWSHRAAEHVMPRGATVSIVGPEAAGIPTTNPDYLPHSPFKPTSSTQPAASYNPVAFRELAGLDGRLNSMGYPGGPVIFMGTVTRPDGTPRLVIITGGSERDIRYMLRSVGAAVLPLPGWFDPLPPMVGVALLRFGGGSGGPPEPAEYRTGAIDPNDPSHVVIPYDVSESSTAMIRAAVAARANARGATNIRPDPAFTRGLTPRVIAQGEIDVRLRNDDTLTFALRGPGQLSITAIGGDPTSLQQAAQASQAAATQRAARGGGPATTSIGAPAQGARSRGSSRGN